jgi:putative endonuclease
MTISLRPYIPMEIIYFEEFMTETEAIQREKYFKTSAGRRYLKKKLGL